MIFLHGWLKDVDIDVYPRCGMEVITIGNDIANVVKTIYAREAQLP